MCCSSKKKKSTNVRLGFPPPPSNKFQSSRLLSFLHSFPRHWTAVLPVLHLSYTRCVFAPHAVLPTVMISHFKVQRLLRNDNKNSRDLNETEETTYLLNRISSAMLRTISQDLSYFNISNCKTARLNRIQNKPGYLKSLFFLKILEHIDHNRLSIYSI